MIAKILNKNCAPDENICSVAGRLKSRNSLVCLFQVSIQIVIQSQKKKIPSFVLNKHIFNFSFSNLVSNCVCLSALILSECLFPPWTPLRTQRALKWVWKYSIWEYERFHFFSWKYSTQNYCIDLLWLSLTACSLPIFLLPLTTLTTCWGLNYFCFN